MSFESDRKVYESILKDIEHFETLMAIKYPDWAQPDFSSVKHECLRGVKNLKDGERLTKLKEA